MCNSLNGQIIVKKASCFINSHKSVDIRNDDYNNSLKYHYKSAIQQILFSCDDEIVTYRPANSGTTYDL